MISVEYLVLRNNVECTRLIADAETNAQISMDNTAEIKMTMTGDFEMNDQINTLVDRLQVIMHIDGTAHPLGKYVICSIEPKTTPAGRRVGSYTAYDLTYLVQGSKTEKRKYIAAGTKYTDALQNLLIESGITDYIIEPSDATIRTDREDWEPGTSRLTICNGTKYTDALQNLLIESGITDYIIEPSDATIRTDREDWEPGTSRLTICNDLLAEINYNSLWMDLQGTIRCNKYRQATAENIAHSYSPGQYSMLYQETSQIIDTFNRANVFIRVVEDAENATPLRAESVNNDPDSALSTVNQLRRVVDYDTLDNIASQGELQAYVDNLKFKSLLATTETTFSTGPNPVHQAFDVIALSFGPDSGIYAETSWSIDLSAPYKMQHKGKRVITGPNPVHQAFDVIALSFGPDSGIYAETSWSIDLSAPYKMQHKGKRVMIL